MAPFFVGRHRELEQLSQAYLERRHVLIVGPPGIGKTTLLRAAQSQLQLLLCEETSTLGRICAGLERHLGLTPQNMNVVERKNRLLPYLARRAQPLALDAVALTPPRVARFIHKLVERIPVWITCRSSRPKEIGTVWQYLQGFERIDLPPLLPNETAALVRSTITARGLTPLTSNQIAALHRIARGNPRTLEELLIELSSRPYNLEDSFERKLLDLDRKIHHATALATARLTAFN